MAGIDSLVNSRADMFAANPQGLQQRYAMNQDLLDLLALQKLKKDKEAAQRSLQMQMQAPQGTVKDQLAGQVMDMTKQEVAASLAPGIQQMGQRMAAEQAQRAMSGGLPTQPAPNMVGMARGGIVGYAPGGDVEPTTPFGRARQKSITEARRKQDEIAAATQLVKRYGVAADPVFGLFKPQTDEERAFAQQVISTLPDISYADKLALLATGEIPAAAPRAESMYQGTDEDIAAMTETLPPMQQRAPRTTEAPAGLPSLVPSRTTPMRQGTEKDIAAMLGEDVAPMLRAEPAPTKDPRMSRYEAELARLEAEEKDKLGALIDFLLAAGASGGTNLGATLMGGGTGLQAREQRIKDEMVKTIQNIETLQLEREQMAAEDERARLSRETQLAVARLQNQAQRPTDMQSRVAAYKAQIMAANPEMSEVQATAKAYEQIQAEDIALAQASAGLGLPQRQSEQKADLRIQAQENALEYLRSQGNFMPSSQEIDAETNRQYQALIAAAGIAPEPGQSTAPQRQVELSPEDRALIESWLPKQGT